MRGDWGRAAVCYLSRKHAGLTLREIGKAAGGIDYAAVCMMLKRFEKRLSLTADVRKHVMAVEELLNVTT